VSVSRYYLDSLVPSWLASDPGYLTALGTHLVDRMHLQGYSEVGWPQISEAPSDVAPPVGMLLVRATITVEEFDIDMGDDDQPDVQRPAPARPEQYQVEQPAGQWLVQQTGDDVAHVVPVDDAVVHAFNLGCVCGPTPGQVPRPGGEIGWVMTHHALDGREQFEPDRGEAGT
jgi:hypothetical protein